jgi:hypothetical protein
MFWHMHGQICLTLTSFHRYLLWQVQLLVPHVALSRDKTMSNNLSEKYLEQHAQEGDVRSNK